MVNTLSHQEWTDKAKSLSIATGLFIDGRLVPAISGETFECVNPANGSVLAHIAKGQAGDIDAAVASAQAAWKDRRWRGLAPRARMDVLLRFADLVQQHCHELALLGPDLHAAVRHPGRRLPELPLHRMLAQRVLEHVAVEAFVEIDVAARHGQAFAIRRRA